MEDQIKINQNRCVGCGRCTEKCPGIFRLNKDVKSELIIEAKINLECVHVASDQCPMGAIEINE